MAIENINPLSNSVIGPADSFSFDIDNTYTSLVVKIGAAGGDEYAYDYALGGAQTGYTVTITDLGSQDRITVKRDSGWDKEPVAVTVVENETGSIVTTQFQLYLTSTKLYPEGMQPYSDAYEGTLIVTEEDVQVRGDVGWIDYNGTDFDLVDLGNGKVRVNANASLKAVGGGGAGLAGIGKWTIANVAGAGTPAAGEVILSSSDNTAQTNLLISTTTEDGQNYDQWMQQLDGLSEGWTFTIYSSDGTKWFSSPVSSYSTGTANYRNVTLNHADKTNSGAHTWTVTDEVYVEILPPMPDTSALDEPSTFGIGGFRYDDDLIDTSPAWTSSSFRLDNVRPSSATKLWIFYSPRQGYDLSTIFDAAQGSKITVQAKTLTNGNFQATLGQPIKKGAGPYYYEFPISDITDSGVDLVDGHYYGATLIPSTASGSDASGFVNFDDVDISINEGTRTLTLTGTFDIYSDGVLYTKTNPSIVWTDSYSPFYFYFNSAGTLTVTSAMTEAILNSNCMVGYLWWHQVNNETAGGFYNMMKHPETPTRNYYHELTSRGLEWYRGCILSPSNYAVDQDGSLDAHCEVGFGSGDALLMGTNHDIASRLSTDAIPKIRRNGSDSGGFYGQEDESTAGLVATTGTGRAGYCAPGSSHSYFEAGDGNFVWAHVCCATGDNYDEGKYIVMMGLDDYTDKVSAENKLGWELHTLRIYPDNADYGLQSVIRPIWSFLVQTKSAYTNAYKSRIVSLSDGSRVADTRSTHIPVTQHSRYLFDVGDPRDAGNSYAYRYLPTLAAVAPGVGDDVDDGYTVGSIWIDTVLDDAYICCDVTAGAAVWKIIAT